MGCHPDSCSLPYVDSARVTDVLDDTEVGGLIPGKVKRFGSSPKRNVRPSTFGDITVSLVSVHSAVHIFKKSRVQEGN